MRCWRRCSARGRSPMRSWSAFQLVNVVRRLLTEGALNAALVPAWLRVRDERGRGRGGGVRGPRARHRQRCAGRGGGLLVGLLMPLVIAALAPGFAGTRDAATRRRRCAADAALSRLRRPGDRDDGAVERAGSLRADGVLAAAVQHRADRRDGGAAAVAARIAALRRAGRSPPRSASPGCCNLRCWCCAGGERIATPLRIVVRRADARLSRQGRARHDRQRRRRNC